MSQFILAAAHEILGEGAALRGDGSLTFGFDTADGAQPAVVGAELMATITARAVELGAAVPLPSYRLFKSVFIRRMVRNEHVDEAAVMEQVLASADAQLRLLFNSVEYFVSDDELFGKLVAAVGAALGEQRAAELLAPE